MRSPRRSHRSRRSCTFAVAGLLTFGVAVAGAQPVATEPIPAPAEAPTPPRPGFIAGSVSVAGLDIGGMTRHDAVDRLLAERVKPAQKRVAVTAGGTRFAVSPRAAGLVLDVRYSVRAAYNFGRSRPVPAGGVDVPLRARVNEKRIESIVRRRASKFDRAARNASLRFRGAKPIVRKARNGREIVQSRAVEQLTKGLLAQRRKIKLSTRRVRPAQTSVPPTVLVQRNRFRLTLYKGGRTRSFPIAVGQPAYPTPAGTYSIANKIQNPTWFPPDSPWAAGIGPVPPGGSNPLGTRWMGFDRNLIGIHGTPVPSSLGTRASHGCIRMAMPQVEWLFNQLSVGSRVVVV